MMRLAYVSGDPAGWHAKRATARGVSDAVFESHDGDLATVVVALCPQHAASDLQRHRVRRLDGKAGVEHRSFVDDRDFGAVDVDDMHFDPARERIVHPSHGGAADVGHGARMPYTGRRSG